LFVGSWFLACPERSEGSVASYSNFYILTSIFSKTKVTFFPRECVIIVFEKRGYMSNKRWIIKEAVARVEVRVGDINYGGHMGNDKALLVFHDARIKFLNTLGLDEKNIGGPGIIMRDAQVTFRKEVFLNDVLVVDVGIENVAPMSFDMTYTVRREKDNAVVFTGSTGLVAFDYEKRRPVKVPEAFLRTLGL
jgi:acyl-CoA thioester hydrolase